ncbi:MAG: hypothetical protein RLY97_1444 [Pseudomonadota bacterium]
MVQAPKGAKLGVFTRCHDVIVWDNNLAAQNWHGVDYLACNMVLQKSVVYERLTSWNKLHAN